MDNASAPAATEGGSTSSEASSTPVSTTTGASSAGTSTESTSTAFDTSLSPGEKAKEEARKFKLKLNVYGKEEDVEFDEPALIKEVQKARAASKIREEAAREREAARQEAAQVAQERQQFQQIVEALKNPQTARQLLRQIGTPLEELSKAELEEYIQQQQMTPEQRELQELRNWRQQQMQQQQLAEQQQQQREYEAQVQAMQEQFSSRIVGAMTKLGLSEKDARASGEIAQRLAFKLEQALNAGWDMSPDELAEELMQDFQEQHRALYGKLPGDKIFQMWGEEGLKKAQEAATKRVAHVPSLDNPNPPKPPGTVEEANAAPIPKFKTRKEWLDYVDALPNFTTEE